VLSQRIIFNCHLLALSARDRLLGVLRAARGPRGRLPHSPSPRGYGLFKKGTRACERYLRNSEHPTRLARRAGEYFIGCTSAPDRGRRLAQLAVRS